MADLVSVSVHRSQFPEQVRQSLLASLRARQVNPKFHYDGTRQTLRWLALHEALSPARQDPDCQRAYTAAFDFLVAATRASRVHVAGLGCGGGWKEAELLRRLRAAGRECVYTPTDVSVPMVMVAHQTALAAVDHCDCHPLVLDLAEARDLPALLDERAKGTPRVITCFGLLPNFEPDVIGGRLRSVVRAGDLLALSANLAPSSDDRQIAESIIPQYDNPPTREWLTGILGDLGFVEGDGELGFRLETNVGELGLLRVVADFVMEREKTVEVDQAQFVFPAHASLRLFFSYRYTAERVEALLAGHGLRLLESWVTPAKDEGVFVCDRNDGR